MALKKTRSYAGTATAGTRAKVSRASLASASTHEEKQDNTSSASNGNEAGDDGVRPEEEDEVVKHAGEKEEVPEVENIPDIPTDDEMPTIQQENELQQTAEHAQESPKSYSGSAELAPTSSSSPTSALKPAAETSYDTEASAEPDEGAPAAEGTTEKVFTGFGPNRPYGKIGLPTEEATPQEAAQRAKDEENKILPVNLRIKQPHDLEEAFSHDNLAKSNENDGEFADKWGTREGSAGLPPLKSPSMLSTKSTEGGENGTGSGSATFSKDNAEVKKVPIWMRKGGEA